MDDNKDDFQIKKTGIKAGRIKKFDGLLILLPINNAIPHKDCVEEAQSYFCQIV